MKRFLLLLMLCATASFAQNLWPDAGFETRGTDNPQAHSGKRAGVIKSGTNGNWQSAYTTDIKVEPFALYKATAWVRREPGGTGTCRTNYVFSWDSFGWWFMTSADVPVGSEWKQVTTHFFSPADKVTFSPLICDYNSKNIVAYVDDLVITRELSAEEHLLKIMAKNGLNQSETELLARYYLSKKDYISIKSLIRKNQNRVGADLSCLLAQEPELTAEKLQHVVDMIRFGALNEPEGAKRWKEFYAQMSQEECIECCLQAIKLGGNNASIEKAIKQYVGGNIKQTGALRLAQRETAVASLKAKMAGLDTSKPLVAMLAKAVEEESKKLAELRARLGHLVLTLCKNQVKAATYAVVLPTDATPSEIRAADELAGYLELVTGESLPVLKETDKLPEHVMLIGRSSKLADYGFSVDYKVLGLEGLCLENRNGNLLLAGGQRGCLYAVYTFLEDYLGCRWFTADCEYTPKDGNVSLDNFRNVKVPRLEYRDTDYPCCRPPEIGVRNRLNGLYSTADGSWGGHVTYRGFVHTFNALVPPSTYASTHPEYYSEINGKRVTERSQLCLTNPDVLRIATETMKKWMRESPNCTIFSVSQNDWHNYCTCKNCSALAEKEGSQAGPLLHFVNAIANEVVKEFPDKIVDTLAYQYTRKPPKYVKPAPNVAVRLCSIECCFIHSIETDPFNQSFVNDIIGWSKICKRLHIWDYVINYRHCIMPFPNLRVLQGNIQFFLKHGVTGIYEEANYFSKGGELSELRSYLLEKLLWDENYPVDKAIFEFTENYYGAAGKYIREYLDTVHDYVCNQKDVHVQIFSGPAFLNNEAMLNKCEQLFQQAEAAVKGDEKLLHRVHVAHLPLIYTRNILKTTVMKLQNNAFTTETAADGIEFFAKVAAKEGITKVREGGSNSLEAWLAQFNAQKKELKLEIITNKYMRLSVLPGIGGRIWSAVDLASGYEMMRVIQNGKDSYDPTDGGYEEYGSTQHRGVGWNEAYTVAEKGDDFVVLKADLRNGLSVMRRIELLKERSGFKVETKFTAKKPLEKAVCRNHPEFNIAEPWKAVIFIKNADGSYTERNLATIITKPDATNDHEIWLADKDKPDGEWGIRFDYNGRQAVIRHFFDISKVGTNYIHCSKPEKRIDLEQWSLTGPATPTSGPEFSSTYTFDIK